MDATHVAVRPGDAVMVVGTMKGLFIGRAGPKRDRWTFGGPYFAGHAVYAAALDERAGRHRIWAAPQSMHFGSTLRYTDDFGHSWSDPEAGILKFPEGTAAALKNIWQLVPGRAEEPETLFCGVEPAALFRSDDAGASWQLVRGLFDHPHRPKWQPGGGGLCLHTIVLHPSDRQRMWVAISSGGVYQTRDGGRTWAASNAGVRAEFLPDKHPEFGQCVHKVVRDPSQPERLFLQNHWGLYRSDDGGTKWKDIAVGVPSDFGFAMASHPRDPGTVFIVPMESDEFRVSPEGKLRVYRTRDAGKSWQPLTRGLPQKNALETVLRDGMATDAAAPAGVYFGTRSGKVYASSSAGDRWALVRDGLPPVVCVRASVTAGKPPGKASARTSKARVRARP